jgi:hypothetical protein
MKNVIVIHFESELDFEKDNLKYLCLHGRVKTCLSSLPLGRKNRLLKANYAIVNPKDHD